MSTTIVNHPPDTPQRELERLEAVLPRLELLERIALRIAVRGIARLQRQERAVDREAALRRHALVLENERRRSELEAQVSYDRPLF